MRIEFVADGAPAVVSGVHAMDLFRAGIRQQLAPVTPNIIPEAFTKRSVISFNHLERPRGGVRKDELKATIILGTAEKCLCSLDEPHRRRPCRIALAGSELLCHTLDDLKGINVLVILERDIDAPGKSWDTILAIADVEDIETTVDVGLINQGIHRAVDQARCQTRKEFNECVDPSCENIGKAFLKPRGERRAAEFCAPFDGPYEVSSWRMESKFGVIGYNRLAGSNDYLVAVRVE